MELPNNEIGISDILQWRDCPARFEFGLRRRTGRTPPETWSPANAYGSAIHLAIARVDEGDGEQDAAQAAFNAFKQWLEPGDLQQLYGDLETYQQRDMIGVETVMSEQDCRVPLFDYEGVTIYFRFTVDRLYRRLDDDTRFISVDYKSSKHPKSGDEVDNDLQQWSYNFGIYELYPEIEDLLQIYDQLRYGQIPTRKSPQQREQMRQWLIAAITGIIEDDELAPSYNEWCPWCPLKMDCPVVREDLTDYALARIAALAPRTPKTLKSGEPGKQLGKPELDPTRHDEYVDELPKIKRARQTLEAVEEAITGTMKGMPDTDLERVGYRKEERSRSSLTPEGFRRVEELAGDDLPYIASVSKTAVERFYGKGDDRTKEIVGQMSQGTPYTVLVADEQEPE